MARIRVAILISGRGSNARALMEAAADPDFPAEIVLLASDQAAAPGLALGEAFGVPTAVVSAAEGKAALEAALDARLRAAGAEIVCLAGFMRLLSAGFVEAWADRILNIHPSLLPAFRGLRPQARALETGVRIAGCTVHVVRPAMDDGPILTQAAVPVLEGDDEAALSARILEAEHRIYPHALRMMAEGRVAIEGGRARIADGHIVCSDALMISGY